MSPFSSEAQRRMLWMKHPEVAKKFAKETPVGKKLPYHKKTMQADAMKKMVSKK